MTDAAVHQGIPRVDHSRPTDDPQSLGRLAQRAQGVTWPSVLVGLTVWRSIEVDTSMCLLKLGPAASSRGSTLAFVPQSNDAVLCRARSILASRFLRTDHDVLLMIDGDMTFSAEDALRLTDKAEAYGVIGGAAMVRRRECPRLAGMQLVGQTITIGEGSPVPLQTLGTGMMAVSRYVLKALSNGLPLIDTDADEPWWPFFHPIIAPDDLGIPRYLSDDASFCSRVRQAGFKVYLDPTVIAGHSGLENYQFPVGTRLSRPTAEDWEVSIPD